MKRSLICIVCWLGRGNYRIDYSTEKGQYAELSLNFKHKVHQLLFCSCHLFIIKIQSPKHSDIFFNGTFLLQGPEMGFILSHLAISLRGGNASFSLCIWKPASSMMVIYKFILKYFLSVMFQARCGNRHTKQSKVGSVSMSLKGGSSLCSQVPLSFVLSSFSPRL